MDIFKGEKKIEKKEGGIAEKAYIVRNPVTRIPTKVIEINAYPSVLKEGTVPIAKETIDSTFKTFLTENKALFGVESEDLKLVSANKIQGKWYVKYQQHYKNIPVYKATVGLDASEKGKVGSYASTYHPQIDVSTEPRVALEKAVETAKQTYNQRNANQLKANETSLIIYPEKKGDKYFYYLAWKFLLSGDQVDPELEKYFIVDALSGKIITSYTANFPGHVAGRVQCEVYPANPTDAVTTVPCRNENVQVESSGQAVTNNSGDYSQNVSAWWIIASMFSQKHCIFRLEGPYVRVQNSDGANYEVSKNCHNNSACNHTWTATDRDHINVFYHMNLFHDWLRDELGYSWINRWDGSSRFNAQVNYTFANAYAGNPMKFGTNNYARSSDVVYHESTHNVLCYIYGDYIGWPDADSEAYAMDEGFADYFASSFTNDSRHGEGASASPRNLDNNKKYPGKVGYSIEGHEGGTIISGAAWIFRQQLIDIHGISGARIADKIILAAHQILSTYPRNYFFSDPHESNFLSAIYRAADDNDNLMDGFPYSNEILHAFYEHNLLQARLNGDDSFDFSTNTIGWLTGGDLYYNEDGKFYANNVGQKGVKDLGNIGDVDLDTIAYSSTGYTRFGVTAVAGHTYLSLAQEGEGLHFIVFRVNAVSADKSNVTIEYLYRHRFIIVVGYVIDLEKMVIAQNIKGDLKFSKGKFYANEESQKGIIDLGDLKNRPTKTVNIPLAGYVRDGVLAVPGHTYASLYQRRDQTRCALFKVESVEDENITLTILLRKRIQF